MAQGNCFVGLLGRNIGAKNPMNSAERLAANLGLERPDPSRDAKFLTVCGVRTCSRIEGGG